jgi:hypothetical protein
MMRRIILVLSIVAIGAAAPARAWCEASCVAARSEDASHCPSHDPAGNTTAISAAGIDECPALEEAKPTPLGRVDANLLTVTFDTSAPSPSAIGSPTLTRPHSATTVFERNTPLRI